MEQALGVHRLHFAFTVTFHYIFPQLTMGLALLLVYLKTKALRTGDDHYNRAARFWARIFGINFALGVVTGIPMEFQFGTNWAEFSRAAGGVIGQTLAMEGVFSFFLESSFLGLFLFGEKKLGRIGHWWAGFLVWLGSWLSGYFIIVANAWMQHPVGYTTDDTDCDDTTNHSYPGNGEICDELDTADVPFEDWSTLERITRHVGRELAKPHAPKETHMATQKTTVELLKDAVDEAKQLVRIEVEVAVEDHAVCVRPHQVEARHRPEVAE